MDTNALSNGTNGDPLRRALPQDWGFATPKPLIAINSGTGNAMDSKFGWYIEGPSERKPIRILGKSVWAYPGLPKLFEYPLLSQERVKLRTSNFIRTFIGSIEQKPIKFSGKVAVSYSGTLENFQGT